MRRHFALLITLLSMAMPLSEANAINLSKCQLYLAAALKRVPMDLISPLSLADTVDFRIFHRKNSLVLDNQSLVWTSPSADLDLKKGQIVLMIDPSSKLGTMYVVTEAEKYGMTGSNDGWGQIHPQSFKVRNIENDLLRLSRDGGRTVSAAATTLYWRLYDAIKEKTSQ